MFVQVCERARGQVCLGSRRELTSKRLKKRLFVANESSGPCNQRKKERKKERKKKDKKTGYDEYIFVGGNGEKNRKTKHGMSVCHSDIF